MMMKRLASKTKGKGKGKPKSKARPSRRHPTTFSVEEPESFLEERTATPQEAFLDPQESPQIDVEQVQDEDRAEGHDDAPPDQITSEEEDRQAKPRPALEIFFDGELLRAVLKIDFYAVRHYPNASDHMAKSMIWLRDLAMSLLEEYHSFFLQILQGANQRLSPSLIQKTTASRLGVSSATLSKLVRARSLVLGNRIFCLRDFFRDSRGKQLSPDVAAKLQSIRETNPGKSATLLAGIFINKYPQFLPKDIEGKARFRDSIRKQFERRRS